MTLNVTTVLPESGGAQPHVRTAQPAISAAGVNDLGTLARQQLANAVPATAFVPAYAGNMTPPKAAPATKTSISIPSSALAAQFIAQTPEISAQEMELFAPRPATLTTSEYIEQGDELLNAMRMARGEIAAPAPVKQTQAAQQQQQQQAAVEKAAQQTTATAAADGGLRVSLAAHLPAIMAPAIRTVTLTQARGISAYQLAESRNAATRKPATVKESL